MEKLTNFTGGGTLHYNNDIVKSHAEFVMSYNQAQDETAGTQVAGTARRGPARRNADGTLYRIPYRHPNPNNTFHPAQDRIDAGRASVMNLADILAYQPELLAQVTAHLQDDGEMSQQAKDSYSLLSEFQLDGPSYPEAPTPSVETEAPVSSAMKRKQRKGASR